MSRKNAKQAEVSNQLTTAIETITPARAAELLKTNTNNRPLSDSWVKTLASAITAGKWKTTHQGIAISKDGVVVDGQHRLSAVIAANKPIDIMVTYNAATDAFDCIDTGRKRTVADYIGVLFGLSHNDSLTASAIISVIVALSGNSSNRISQNELCSMFEMYRPGITWALQYSTHNSHGVPTPVLAALVWAYKKYPTACEYLATKYIKPTYLHEGSPVFAIINAAQRGKHTQAERKALALKTLRALEAVIEKKTLFRCEASTSVLDRLAGAN